MSEAKEPTFEELMKELDGIVAWFEDEQLDLDVAVEKYERGAQLADELKKRLKKTENKIKKINASLGEA